MIHRPSKRRGIVQIKTGAEPVDLAALAAARADNETHTFAFATSGNYNGDRSLVTEVICTDELLQFAAQHRELLPSRVQTWFDLGAEAPGGLDTSLATK